MRSSLYAISPLLDLPQVAELPSAVYRAREIISSNVEANPFSLNALAGRFIELTGGADSAALSIAATLVQEVQRLGRYAAWIGRSHSLFFPPDFAAAGIDLAALPVVCVDTPLKASRAADTLLRSGAFALIIVDLGPEAQLSLAIQSRLIGLAKKHATTLLSLTRQAQSAANGTAPGSLVSLRIETSKERIDRDSFVCRLHALKDKQRTPGWTYTEIRRGVEELV